MKGFLVLHHLPELAQTHVDWVSDAIQAPHPLSSPSPPALNLSQHQGLFQWVGSSHQVAEVLEFQLQHQSFQWVFSPFKEKIIQWMVSFRIDWFDLLAVQASLIQHNSPLRHTQETQHNVPGLLWVKHRVSGPLPYSAPCKDKSVAVQAMFAAAFSYTTFSCKSLYCMLEKGSPIKDRRDNVCCGWQYQIAVKL